MFSKSKKQKSEKVVHQPKLRGMPALKHMRSTKREEYLLKKTLNTMPSISDLEQQNEQNQTHLKSHPDDELKVKLKVDLILTPSYEQPSQSARRNDSSAQPFQPRYLDSNSNGVGSDFVIHNNSQPYKKRDSNLDVEIGSPTSSSQWRFSKGDSGYKSQSDSRNGGDKAKSRKTKRRSDEARTRATSGLHYIKQQRKASRESVSQSMRALTPKERESIRALENVIRIANEIDSADDVFHSDSDGDDNFENSCKKIDEDADEAIDYGYASVNDVSRRFSIESIESVGSIIDLVGNLSTTSASSSTSPIYSAVDKTYATPTVQGKDLPENSNGEANGGERNGDDAGLLRWNESYSHDARKHYEEVLSHFDEVINSFSLQSDDENIYEEVEHASKVERETFEKPIDSSRGIIKRTEMKNDREDYLESKEREERKLKEKKYRDPEKEKERKERKKKRKEEKRARRQKEEKEQNEARIREENIARHVEAITALTQDMIMTVQQEPIYAQVDKTRKLKNKTKNHSVDSSRVIAPPVQSSNEQMTRNENPSQGPSKLGNNVQEAMETIGHPPEKYNYTSTTHASPESHKTAELTGESSPKGHLLCSNDHRRECSGNNLNHASIISPSFHKCHTTVDTAITPVSPSMLHASSENLRHVPSPGASGKSVQIKPKACEHHNETNITGETALEQFETGQASTSSRNNLYRHPSDSNHNCRQQRPLSLNLDATQDSATCSIKPYSSFRIDRTDHVNWKDKKSKPFVITALKKPLQLC